MRAAFIALVLASVAAAQGAAPPPPPAGGGAGAGGGGGGAAPPPAANTPSPNPSPTPSNTAGAAPPASQPPTTSSAQPPPATQAQATSSKASASPSPQKAPAFTFLPIPTATQCEQLTVEWRLSNEDASEYNVSLYVYNAGVDQGSPAKADSVSNSAATKPVASKRAAASPKTTGKQTTTKATPTAKTTAKSTATATPKAAEQEKRGSGDSLPAHLARAMPYDYASLHLAARADTLNTSIARDQPAKAPFEWKVDVPEGRYRILALVNDKALTWAESDSFSVVAGSDTSCVKGGSSSSSAAAPASTDGAASDNAEAGTKKKGIGGGAIAGIVIGVLAALILAAVAFYCLRKVRRDRRRDAGGLREQPMRGLIGAPTNFRKTKGAGSGPRSSVGHALSALGFNNGGKAERADRGIHSHAPNEKLEYQSSTYTAGTGTNPFDSAPNTPVEEKDRHLQPTHTPGSSFGTSIPPSSALAAGAAGIAGADSAAQSWRGSHQTHPSTGGYPSTSPNVDAEGGNRFSGLPYDTVVINDDGRSKSAAKRVSTPTPMRLPAANLASTPAGASTPSGAMTPSASDGLSPTATAPHSPVAPINPAAHSGGHARSASLEGGGSTTGQPPSAFTAATPSSPQATVQRSGSTTERKTSLRRKPVPRLSANPAYATPDRSSGAVTASSTGAAAGATASPAGGVADADNSPPENLRPPDHEAVGAGPAGDEFGLNAALGTIGQHEFSLIPDPPMEQHSGSER